MCPAFSYQPLAGLAHETLPFDILPDGLLRLGSDPIRIIKYIEPNPAQEMTVRLKMSNVNCRESYVGSYGELDLWTRQ